jgi:uncharacterized protein YjbJ (UPF0337 family)
LWPPFSDWLALCAVQKLDHSPNHFVVALTALKPNKKELIMNTMEAKGDWNIVKGKLKQKWGKLTDNDLSYSEGQDEELFGRLQKATGETREAVEKALKDAGFKRCNC